MDLDPSFLSELPLQHRQKICRQIRQKQVEKYIEFEKSDRGKEGLQKTGKKKNKKGTSVNFETNFLLQEAVDSFNDREVLKLLKSGSQSNFKTGNGTSLLHRCAAEDNASAAELLLSHGADINACDDDWWTPLHTACSCDSVEVVQFLLNNGADTTVMDVDGYFPVDQAGDNTETKGIVTKHMEKLGINSDVLHQRRQARQTDLLNHIKGLPLAADVNQLISDGVSLIHIAAANGYPGCLKALFKYGADVNRLDKYGWSPLHIAAKFNQLKAVELLLKKKANANLKDSLGCKPSAYTSSDHIRGLIMKYERKQEREPKDIPKYLDLSALENKTEQESEANVYDEINDASPTDERPEGQAVGVFRINSKTVRPKHGSISKEDELMEAKQMYEAIADPTVEYWPRPPPPVSPGDFDDDEEDDKGDYISMAIWKSGAQEQGNLVPCMESDNFVAKGTVKENDILTDLQQRYASGQIYTFISDILLAVNPFKELPCYAKDISMRYHNQPTDSSLPPHIYGIAENSFTNMLKDRKSQCHVISGESGSGKTETCKYLIQHLLRVAGSEETNLNSKINQVNPLLEAFGNAVTVMNNNSSRFGKYVELGFTANGKVTGARISEYMLEKSRVVHQEKGELSFHIFYWMMVGLSPEEVKVYRLDNMDKLRYIRHVEQGMESMTSVVDNKAKFWEVKDCLKDIGFSSADIENLFMTLSAVLHLGEITFCGVGNNDAAQVKNMDILKKASELLDVSDEELGSALVAEYTMTRGEQIKKERTVVQAEDCRDALAKTLYGRLFSWIVNGINQLIQPPEDQADDLQIGILDIFGFEDFKHNSFEQICINVANEQIQLFTNDHIFFQEQQDCMLEGVPVVDINFSSNQAILDLFLERHTGVFSIMDEESNFPKATDRSLATKLHQNTGKKHEQYYKTPKDGGQCFTVVHYAGSVTYDVRGILEKNRDTLPNSVIYTMKSSNRLLLKELFQSRVTRTGSLAPSARQKRSRRSRRTTKKSASPFDFFKKLRGNKEQKKPTKQVTVEKKGPSTMAYHFRNSLNDLVSKLSSASPHFVRCIKPNTSKTAMKFDPEIVSAQLRYTGVADIVKIRKFGYAVRLSYHAFVTRYKVLVACCLPKFCPMTEVKKCEHMVKHYKVQDVKFGKTKIFLKTDQANILDQLVAEEERKVTKAQAVIRGFLGRQKSKRLASVREEQQKSLSALMTNVDKQGNTFESRLRNSLKHDHEEHQQQLKKNEVSKIADSMNILDDVILGYEKLPDPNTGKTSPVAYRVQRTVHDDDDDLYDDAFSVQREADNVKATEFNPDDMNGHMHRGLPPTPTHMHGIEGNRPPPCPREMYSQGMYACIDDQGDYKRQAPPPPRRNPDTRLSTASVSSTSSATYEELHVEEAGTHPHHHQQQYHQQQYHQQQNYHGNQNMTQRHASPGSPQMRSKYNHEPQSPSHAAVNRPFSYGAAVMSPKLKHTSQANGAAHMPHNQNGQSELQHPQVLYNYQYEDTHTGSPAAAYGKHESAFHPQPHRPPPHGPPPPPPPGGYSHHDSQAPKLSPQSPKMQRHSVTTLAGSPQNQRAPASPRMAQKLSQRSKSVPASSEEEMHLPAPPPPLPLRENYMATAVHTQRPPSPPLPPPPPELLESPCTSRELPPLPGSPSAVPQSTPYNRNQGLPNSYHPHPQAPPPPPINTIPKKQAQSFDEGFTNGRGNNSDGPNIRGSPAVSAVTSPQASREASPSAAELMNALSKVQLKKTAGEVTSTPVDTREAITISGVKLRPTSARLKLLGSDGLKPAPEEQAPPPREPSPPPPPPSEPQAPPPSTSPQQVQVSPAVSMFEQKVESLSNNNKPDNMNRNKGDTSKNSNMSICIDDIDLSEVPGYTPITNATPIWKRDMIEKKNQEKLEEYIKKKERQKQEAEKWKNVPEWKRKLMQEKEKEKMKMGEDEIKRAAEEEAARKRRAKEAEEERRIKIKEQQEMEKKMQEELQSVPAWKREIMMKKGGALKNWGDEREDINKQPGEEGYVPPGDDEDDYEYNEPVQQPQQKQPPPQQQQQTKQPTHQAKLIAKESPATPPPPKPRMSLDEAKLEEEWETLPLWKREILMKRGGAPSNWGDEREDLNDEQVDY